MKVNNNELTGNDVFSQSMARRDGVPIAGGAIRIGVGIDRVLRVIGRGEHDDGKSVL